MVSFFRSLIKSQTLRIVILIFMASLAGSLIPSHPDYRSNNVIVATEARLIFHKISATISASIKAALAVINRVSMFIFSRESKYVYA